jgi:hypothetical protein
MEKSGVLSGMDCRDVLRIGEVRDVPRIWKIEERSYDHAKIMPKTQPPEGQPDAPFIPADPLSLWEICTTTCP